MSSRCFRPRRQGSVQRTLATSGPVVFSKWTSSLLWSLLRLIAMAFRQVGGGGTPPRLPDPRPGVELDPGSVRSRRTGGSSPWRWKRPRCPGEPPGKPREGLPVRGETRSARDGARPPAELGALLPFRRWAPGASVCGAPPEVRPRRAPPGLPGCSRPLGLRDPSALHRPLASEDLPAHSRKVDPAEQGLGAACAERVAGDPRGLAFGPGPAATTTPGPGGSSNRKLGGDHCGLGHPLDHGRRLAGSPPPLGGGQSRGRAVRSPTASSRSISPQPAAVTSKMMTRIAVQVQLAGRSDRRRPRSYLPRCRGVESSISAQRRLGCGLADRPGPIDNCRLSLGRRPGRRVPPPAPPSNDAGSY